MIVKPKVVNKAWGQEIWIHNDEEYCGKLLKFNKKGNAFSMHYHIIKKESWYVGRGSFEYKWIDTETGITREDKIGAGDVVRQRIGQPHQLIAYTDGVVFEVSTQHFDSDSYRIYKGD